MDDAPDLAALLRKAQAEQQARARRRRAHRLLTGSATLIDLLVVDDAGNVITSDDLLIIP